MNAPGMMDRDRVVIANCSGFFGDRLSAAREMVRGGPIDVLTGDYLAELTMAILFKQKMEKPAAGYAHTFLVQMEQVMGECLDKGIRVVANAGGLNPKGLAGEIKRIAEKLGLNPKVAYIEGDDLMPRLAELQEQGEPFIHLDKGITLKEGKAQPITANAYMGGWGVAEALRQGADIVVTGRIVDVAMTVGPAAWWFGWGKEDWDRLAGATVAGHIIECGAQATGGNYSFIDEIPSFLNVGFPVAEIYTDGSFVISKHPGTGGLVSVDTVKAQLLYEVREPKYLTPDVVARFDTIDISQEGPDRVKIKGVKGEPPPSTTKVCLNTLGGYRNSKTILLTGLDIEKKAKILEETLFESIGGREQFAFSDVRLIRSDKEDPRTNEEAFAHLRFSVIDPDPKKVAKMSTKIIELALASIPGFTGTEPPSKGTPIISHWPTFISSRLIRQKVVVEGQETLVDSVTAAPLAKPPEALPVSLPVLTRGKTVKMPFGRFFATRSGDKGGNANLGVWAKTPESFAFLVDYLTVDRLKDLLKDMRTFE
ncbi:MAG TPA: acyclic terpene utilization AtuA family protein, partial [Thermodesulfobacteriota bacterium]|nr:acyclic terpene utilization AtuA family protein [Thermodesulfobacteriota bacterium]